MRSCLIPPILLACAACQSVPSRPVEAVSEGIESRRAAIELWQEGQRSLHQGEIERAIYCCMTSLKEAPDLKRNHLSLAAAYVEQGNDAHAVKQLECYVQDRPDDLAAHSYCAELHWRLRRLREARDQFRHCDALAQEMGAEGMVQRIHFQCRLVKIAELTDDEYGEHLHRGIGLLLLAKVRAQDDAEAGSKRSAEALLCRAAAELTQAQERAPHEAQPAWYLHEVWSRLGQTQPALKCLRQADEAAPLTRLSPAEQRELQLACWKQGIRKHID